MRSRTHLERELVTQEEVASLASDIKHCVSAMMKEPEHDEIKATLNDAGAIGLRIQSIG
jgi:hypothetical protein